MGVRELKKELRDNIIKKRTDLSAEQKDKLDRELCSRFTRLICYKHAKSVILYASLKSEPDTFSIMQQILKAGKRLALPRCVVEKTEMIFYEVRSNEDLVKGSYGIMEPNPSRCKRIDPFTFDIALVPALAFDSYGYRIGYGKGYYDRFLDRFEGTKIGMAYSDFLLKKLPRGRFDRKVDIILTEKGVNMVAQG